MDAMFQTWKNIVLKKDMHLGPICSFYYECTHTLRSMIIHVLFNMISTPKNLWHENALNGKDSKSTFTY